MDEEVFSKLAHSLSSHRSTSMRHSQIELVLSINRRCLRTLPHTLTTRPCVSTNSSTVFWIIRDSGNVLQLLIVWWFVVFGISFGATEHSNVLKVVPMESLKVAAVPLNFNGPMRNDCIWERCLRSAGIFRRKKPSIYWSRFVTRFPCGWEWLWEGKWKEKGTRSYEFI